MTEIDRAYLARRASEERALADGSTGLVAQKHAELAALYEERLHAVCQLDPRQAKGTD